MPPKTKKDQ